MSAIIIAIILFGLAFLGFRHYIKGKGSCGDCEGVPAPSKDEMRHRIDISKFYIRKSIDSLGQWAFLIT